MFLLQSNRLWLKGLNRDNKTINHELLIAGIKINLIDNGLECAAAFYLIEKNDLNTNCFFLTFTYYCIPMNCLKFNVTVDNGKKTIRKKKCF